MKKIKFSINTLGCKTNQSESDYISRTLVRMGLSFVLPEERPDFCIINTCVVTSQGESKSRQMIRKIKNLNPDAKVLVTGCLAGSGQKFLEDSGIDLVVKNDEKDRIPGLVFDMISGITMESSMDERSYCINDDDFKNITGFHSRPLVKIQDGCQQNCSYCIVPSVRGKYRSMNPSKIIGDIIYFKNMGYEEVVLTGIHVGKYGFDGAEEKTGSVSPLENLIDKIISETGIRRIRISSIEINELTEGLLNSIRKNKKYFANHFHIPLQSGSNKILGLMKRPYDSTFFLQKVKLIKEFLPEFALTTDVMAGFPGEDEADFKDTMNLVNEAAFSKLHVFRYSERPGTAAIGMPGKVDEMVKSKRAALLRKAGEKMRRNFLNENIGRILEIVCEKACGKLYHAGNPDCKIFEGTSGNYIKVYFPGDDNLLITGKIIKARGQNLLKDGLFAEII